MIPFSDGIVYFSHECQNLRNSMWLHDSVIGGITAESGKYTSIVRNTDIRSENKIPNEQKDL